jgi:hypothetical protein
LKRNFPFHQLFLDLLLSGSALEREREFKERGKKSLSTLKSGSTQVALPVWYNPPASIQVLSGCLPYSYNGLGAFPQFPKGETLLNKREREREREVGLRDTP